MPSDPANTVRIGTISRVEHFSAAHRLHSPHLTDEENLATFGKCNHPNFHGHNYTIQVFVKGPINVKNGMVINITDLKACIHECVMKHVDHRNLDLDVAYFKTMPSTTENLAVFIFEAIENGLPKYTKTGDGVSGPKLEKVMVWETVNNIVEYSG
ncbi:hypothetical protein RI367_004294 [Sorochytrium milnesiophthora]